MRIHLLLVALAAAGHVVAAEPLTLDEATAVARALEVAHPAAAAAAYADAAAARLDRADARTLPEVQAYGRVERRSSVPEFQLDLPGGGGEPVTIFPDITTTYSTAIEVEQILYAGGAIGAERERARQELGAAYAEAELTAADVRLAARLAYWTAAAADADVAAAMAEIERADRLLEDARNRVDGGVAVPAEVYGAEARRAAAELRRVRAVNERQVARATLRSLLHLPREQELELTQPLASPPPSSGLEVLLQRAAQQRPELRAARARLAAAEAAIAAADAQDEPRVSAQAQWRMARPNPRYLPLRDEWNDSWSVALAGRWSLFDGGAADAAEAEARAVRRAAAEELEETGRQLELEVVARWQELQSAREAVPAARAAVRAAAARQEAEAERYRDGMATAADVLDAQAELAEAERNQVEALAGAARAAALLDRAAGA